MRIISDFKDYYDIGHSLGSDQSIVYKRFKKTVKDIRNLPTRNYGNPTKYGPKIPDEVVITDRFIIGFCGKIYPLYKCLVNVKNLPRCFYLYSLEEFDKLITQTSKKTQEEYYKKKIWYFWAGIHRKKIKESFDEIHKQQNNFAHLFQEYKTPIFIASEQDRGIRTFSYRMYGRLETISKLELHGYLKQYQFYKIFDPYQAFQEIQMYITNELCDKEDKIPQVDDKTMVGAKGFDEKWSFRKKGKK